MHENRKAPQPDPIENDAVWKLLDHSRPHSAGPRFVDDVVRRARMDADAPVSWWSRGFSPAPAMAVAGLAAAFVAGFFVLRPAADDPPGEIRSAVVEDAADQERLAHLQEVLETEMLFAAVEHLEDFSDAELISLIGF